MENNAKFQEYSSQTTHYENRLNTILQQMEEVTKTIAEFEVLAEEGWKGQAGTAAKEKLHELMREIKLSQNDIDEALTQLRFLRNAMVEQMRSTMSVSLEAGCK